MSIAFNELFNQIQLSKDNFSKIKSDTRLTLEYLTSFDPGILPLLRYIDTNIPWLTTMWSCSGLPEDHDGKTNQEGYIVFIPDTDYLSNFEPIVQWFLFDPTCSVQYSLSSSYKVDQYELDSTVTACPTWIVRWNSKEVLVRFTDWLKWLTTSGSNILEYSYYVSPKLVEKYAKFDNKDLVNAASSMFVRNDFQLDDILLTKVFSNTTINERNWINTDLMGGRIVTKVSFFLHPKAKDFNKQLEKILRAKPYGTTLFLKNSTAECVSFCLEIIE